MMTIVSMDGPEEAWFTRWGLFGEDPSFTKRLLGGAVKWLEEDEQAGL